MRRLALEELFRIGRDGLEELSDAEHPGDNMSIHAFVTWQASLPWSRAAFWLLAAVIVIVLLACLIGKALTINEMPEQPRRSYPIADYSAQYDEKREWLGDKYLFAKPINRRERTRPAPWDGAVVPDVES